MPILRRTRDALTESYTVHADDDGRLIGRVFHATGAVPEATPWVRTIAFDEWQGCTGPQYGNAVDRNAAVTAFKRVWGTKIARRA